MANFYTKHTLINYYKGNSGRKYIVIHYTGNRSDTAAGNAAYFYRVKRGASAHYFVDENDIYEVVGLDNTAWSVGKNYGHNNLFGICTNKNSINIEMCSTDGRIADKTVANTVELVKSLMQKFNISADRVVRHYDVCSKRCPGWPGWIPPEESLWKNFKAALGGSVPASKPVAQPTQPVAQPTQKKNLLVVDGKLGPATIKAWQKRLGVTADGIIGPHTIRAIQRWAGSAVDGKMGPNTRKAVQRKLGVTADGVWGPNTIKALQRWLNN
ncbi:MAG: N-acetylmuramoyl-L-alanine amidase [Lachnospiraceae bacterium]|nr:N-acetylmuramoyl-L-alanine amidase [Lachnospiraceae bacterium]